MHVSGSATAVAWMPSEIVLFRCDTGGPAIVYMYIAPSRRGNRGRDHLCPEPLVFLRPCSLQCYLWRLRSVSLACCALSMRSCKVGPVI